MHRTLLSRSLRSQLQHCPHRIRLYQRHSSDWSHLQSELTSRRLPLVYDYLTPTHSHLLNVAVSDILPKASSSSSHSSSSTTTTTTNSTSDPPASATLDQPPTLPNTTTTHTLLPPTHHIIYFPPAIPGPLLLPDGTDPLQSPGPPFIRRMWAGGSVRFLASTKQPLPLSGARAVCLETIRDVSVKGAPGQEKIFVGIERRVARTRGEEEDEEAIRERVGRKEEAEWGDAEVIERRNIVFMRERSRELAVREMEAAKTKMLMPPAGQPAFEIAVKTDEKLLFRYSALTFNAHAIHLDPGYCREIEGHRGLLVHGPLSFTLLMTALRRCLRERAAAARGSKEEVISSVEYRNLAPLYCGEPLKICGKEREEGRWDVWAETPEGGIAVKGSVRTEVGERVEYADLGMMGL